MKSGKRTAAPAGLPGDKEQIRQRRARLRMRLEFAALAVATWGTLIFLVGPARVSVELPALGPATRDLVALRDFDAEEPVADLRQRQEAAVAAVPLHYTFDKNAAARRIDAIHAAFRQVRPRYRLYVADRERTLEAARTAAAHPHRPDAPDPVAVLDQAYEDELLRLRPEFEAAIAPRHAEIGPDVFATLRKAGFAEEVELLLTDVAQVLLSQRIVREIDRLEDDLGRGVLETDTDFRYDRRAMPQKVIDVEQALTQAEDFAVEFIRQKKPSRLDDPVLQAAVRQLTRGLVEPTFQRDLAGTRAAEAIALAAVAKTRMLRYTKGQSLVKRGDVVTQAVQERVAAAQRGWRSDSMARPYAATALLLAVVLGLFTLFARRHLHHFRHRPHDISLLAVVLILHAATLRGWLILGEALVEPGGVLTAEMWLVAMPMALGPSMAALFLKPFTAAPFSLVCAGMAAMMALNSSFVSASPGLAGVQAVLALVVGLAGVQASRRFRTRADLLRGAVMIGASGVVCAAAVVLFTVPTAALLDEQNALVLAMGAGTGLTTYLMLTALTPVLELTFNRLTDIKLLELASMNHPALRLLATEAPGTFTHSVMVGNLAQAGCDAVGANGLMARVGAYYHDLGKTKAARYFAENQGGDNPHDRLKPHLSALIIKSHVKDGIKLLKDFRLPDEIIDFVPQHHGTSLIVHFFHRAQREAMETGEEVNEADFRYPGPKPQRRETAMLMIADSVEAATKALPDPNPVRVAALVKRIIAGKLEDGQLDECDLTLRELALVEQAFVKTLLGIHHSRPVYAPPVQQPLALTHSHAAGGRAETHMPQMGDDLRRVAILSDGGVGVRSPANKQNVTLANPPPDRSVTTITDALAKTGQHDRPTLSGAAEGDNDEPEAPTALVAQKSPAPRRNPPPRI